MRTIPTNSTHERPKKATLKDVAREAEVSPTTVSLVLSLKSTARVSEPTRTRVLEAVSRLNYRPNHAGRMLVTNRSATIGLVVTTLLNPFYSEIAQKIIERATEKGYSVIICSARKGLEDTSMLIYSTLDRGVEGLIISSLRRKDTIVYELREKGIPFVLTLRKVDQNAGSPRLDMVVVDNQLGGFLAIDHLLRLGHRTIGLIAGPMETSTGYDRYIGAKAAFERHGIPLDEDFMRTGDFDRSSGYRIVNELLDRHGKKITAFFAFNDIIAMGALEALREKGLSVPEDIAIVGFDDIEMASLPGVDLTTISEKKEIMGHLSVDILIDKIQGASPNHAKQVILEPALVVRASCGFARRGHRYPTEGEAHSTP